jgi:chemotaxis protein histidine kinase CheA
MSAAPLPPSFSRFGGQPPAPFPDRDIPPWWSMGLNPPIQNQGPSALRSVRFADGPTQAVPHKRLQSELAQAAANEATLKNEIETLKTSLTRALSSEREMRASARDARQEWERVERALLEEINVLRGKLAKTENVLTKVMKALNWEKVFPFVRRLIKGTGSLVEEMITLEEPPISQAESRIRNEYGSLFQAGFRL